MKAEIWIQFQPEPDLTNMGWKPLYTVKERVAYPGGYPSVNCGDIIHIHQLVPEYMKPRKNDWFCSDENGNEYIINWRNIFCFNTLEPDWKNVDWIKKALEYRKNKNDSNQ